MISEAQNEFKEHLLKSRIEIYWKKNVKLYQVFYFLLFIIYFGYIPFRDNAF